MVPQGKVGRIGHGGELGKQNGSWGRLELPDLCLDAQPVGVSQALVASGSTSGHVAMETTGQVLYASHCLGAVLPQALFASIMGTL